MDFCYYSYSRKSTGWEFFVPAGTLIVIKLLSHTSRPLSWDKCVTSIVTCIISKQHKINILSYWYLRLSACQGFMLRQMLASKRQLGFSIVA